MNHFFPLIYLPTMTQLHIQCMHIHTWCKPVCVCMSTANRCLWKSELAGRCWLFRSHTSAQVNYPLGGIRVEFLGTFPHRLSKSGRRGLQIGL